VTGEMSLPRVMIGDHGDIRAADSGRDWLTAEQRAAVEWGEGPLMVLAGAGTGKTTVVVERVRYVLDNDPDLAPENVLVLT